MGKYDITINLLKRTFGYSSKRGKSLVNNKELKTFIFNNEKMEILLQLKLKH